MHNSAQNKQNLCGKQKQMNNELVWTEPMEGQPQSTGAVQHKLGRGGLDQLGHRKCKGAIHSHIPIRPFLGVHCAHS